MQNRHRGISFICWIWIHKVFSTHDQSDKCFHCDQTLFGRSSETNTCWAFVCERPCTPSLGSLLESNRRSDPAPEHQTARHLLGSRDPLQGTAGTHYITKQGKSFPIKGTLETLESFFFLKNMYCQWGLRKSNIQSANASKCVWRDNTTEKVSVFNQGTVTSEFQK